MIGWSLLIRRTSLFSELDTKGLFLRHVMQPWLYRSEQGLTSLHTTSLKIGEHLEYSLISWTEFRALSSPAEQDTAMMGSFAEMYLRNSNPFCERTVLS